MMIDWKKKIKSNRGASMILALALMLICVMISSIILAAAASGSSRNANRLEQQRAYLAVSSATDLIVKDLKSMQNLKNPDTLLEEPLTFVGRYDGMHYGCMDCTIVATMEYEHTYLTGTRLDTAFIPEADGRDEGHLIYDDPTAHAGQEIVNGKVIHNDEGAVKTKDTDASTDVLAYSTTIFGELLMDAAEYVYTKEEEYTETFEIALDESGLSEQRLPKAVCTFTMDTNFGVKIHVGAEGSSYSVIISMTANEPIAPIDEDDNQISCTHRVYYKNYNESTGIYEDVVEEWTLNGTKEYTSRTINWNTPTVAKGVGQG